MGVIVIYIYALIGFAFFRPLFNTGDEMYCGTLGECSVTLLRYGGAAQLSDVGIQVQPFVPKTCRSLKIISNCNRCCPPAEKFTMLTTHELHLGTLFLSENGPSANDGHVQRFHLSDHLSDHILHSLHDHCPECDFWHHCGHIL